MKNIEMFNLVVAEVTGLCYEHFPQRIDVTSHTVAEKIANYYDIDEDDAEAVSDFIYVSTEMADSTVNWLQQAGYLWVEGQSDYSFYGVTLTPKALELMNMVPDSLEETIGSKLVSSAKAISKQTAMSAAGSLLSAGVKLATGSLM
ncbi:hypothetical protein AL538_08335 [Vibrio harveyi]|uniref:DUF2513 domain-containing protein n=1 Tax=Vibrio harveyi TaxID=669 RepID=A0ABM5XX03_VIBHA|nr:hypothetical protein [Vibrio harveyi]AMF97726.1 hypothetical protein AL538_08335 [Vibrio harveyi]